MKTKTAILGYYHGPKLGVGVFIDKFISHLPAAEDKEFVLYTNKNTAANITSPLGHVQIMTPWMLGAGSLPAIIWSAFIFPMVCLLKGFKTAVILANPIVLIPILRFIVVINDLNEFEMSKKYGRIRTFYRKKIMLPGSMRNSTAIVAISEFVKRQIQKYFPAVPEGRVRVIPEGVDNPVGDESRTAGILRDNGLADNGYYLIVGRIDPHGKNLYAALKLYLRLEREHPGRKLVLAGGINDFGSGEADNFLQMIRSNRNYINRVQYLGHVDELTLSALYQGAMAVILFSRVEGFGFPMMEAFKHGCPVLFNAACQVLLEQAEGAGFPIDENDLNEGRGINVTAIYNPEQRAALAVRMAAIAQKYDWDRNVTAYLKLIAETAGEKI